MRSSLVPRRAAKLSGQPSPPVAADAFRSLAIRVLGPVQVTRGGRAVELGARRERAVLVLLAVHGAAVSRTRLSAQLWPDADESEALARLRRLLHDVGHAVGGDVLDVTRQQVSLSEQARDATDIAQLRLQLQRGLYRQERSLDGDAVAALEKAAVLTRGDLAEGLSIDESDELAAWLDHQRESLRQTRHRVLARLADHYEQRCEFERGLEYARAVLVLDPLQEPAQRQVMRLLAATGQVPAALRQFEQCRATLQAELGVEPAAETLRLVDELRARAVAPTVYVSDLARPADVRFTRHGDVHLAYQTFGSGPIDLLFISGFVSHLDQVWEPGGPVGFFRALAKHARVILYDRRGVGLSDRMVDAADIATSVGDALAVLDAAHSRRAVVFAVSEGGPIAIRLAVQWPQRIAGLALCGTMAKGLAAADYPWALEAAQFERWSQQLISHWGNPSSIEVFAPEHAGDPTLRRWWAQTLRLGASPGSLRAVLRTFAGTDVRGELPAVAVPTVVMHRREDRAVRPEAGRHLAAQIPGARWLELAGRSHWWWLDDDAPIVAAIVELLQRAAAMEPPAERSQAAP